MGALRISIVTFGVVSLGLSACGNGDSGDCQEAAQVQAAAEDAWGAELEAHSTAHSAAVDSHSGTHEELTTLRVNLIMATAATQKTCR